ncbi:MAG: glycerol-3-phosphate dehydrogenase, partial [Gilliamella sp.]|nr:glycerol-3-phosphate dehydrogenase [Gilliamella sp.]
MMKKDAAVTVIGAGSYGTSLAILLARNGHSTLLWGHNPDKMTILQHDRQNKQFLPNIPFPDLLQIETDLKTAVSA